MTALLSLASVLLSLLFWWVKRRASQADDPMTQNEKRYEQIDEDLAARDGAQAGVHGGADLDEIERLQRTQGGGGAGGSNGNVRGVESGVSGADGRSVYAAGPVPAVSAGGGGPDSGVAGETLRS